MKPASGSKAAAGDGIVALQDSGRKAFGIERLGESCCSFMPAKGLP